jgi:Ca-activated chloride channel family protein
MTMPRRLLILALALLVSAAAAAQSDSPRADRTLSPYFFVEGGDPAVDRLPLKDTRVDVAIAGVVADVTVRQVYENRGQRPLHARYVFPASTRAAVYGMTMTVGDTRLVATIRERSQAKQQFEAAKSEGKSATLLEQSRPNVFTMNVANVMPGDTIAVELKYTELLVPTDGVYEFVYPTVVGPRYSSKTQAEAGEEDGFVRTPYTHEGEAPRSGFHLAGQLSTGVPIHDLSSPSHQIVSRAAGQGRAEFSLGDSDGPPNNRDFILRYRLEGDAIASGLLLYQGRDENFFLLTAQPPAVVRADEAPPREYIFVLDVSGSMNGFPLNTAKKLMRDLVATLHPGDMFNIVVFASGTELMSPAALPATPDNFERAMRFVGPKQGGGGTELLGAIKLALAHPRQPSVARTVVLVTDGYIEAEKDVFDWIRAHLDETNVFAFGIGSAVNRHLIEGVARAGQGSPFVVTGADDAADMAGTFRRYIDSPVMTGIHVRFAGFDAYDVEPRTIPDLFASRPIVVFGKWRGAIGGTVEITGTTGRQPYRSAIAIGQSIPDERHRALRHLWARTRIANLSDYGAPLDQDRVGEITSLGLTYSLLTSYTSFIAVHEVVRRAGEAATSVDQPNPLPQGVGDLAVGGVTNGPEPELLWVIAALIAAAFVSCGRLRIARGGVES